MRHKKTISILIISILSSPLFAQESASPTHVKSYVESIQLQATSQNRNKTILGTSGIAVMAYGATNLALSRKTALKVQDQAALKAAEDINQSGEKLAEEIRQGKFPKDPHATISVVQEMSREDFKDLVNRAREEKGKLTREIVDLEKRTRLLQAQLAKGEAVEALLQNAEQDLEFKKSARMTYTQIMKNKPDKIANLKGMFLRTDFKDAKAAQTYIEQLSRQKIPTAATIELAKSEQVFKRAKILPRSWGALTIASALGSAYTFLQLQFDVDMQSSTEVIGEASR